MAATNSPPMSVGNTSPPTRTGSHRLTGPARLAGHRAPPEWQPREVAAEVAPCAIDGRPTRGPRCSQHRQRQFRSWRSIAIRLTSKPLTLAYTSRGVAPTTRRAEPESIYDPGRALDQRIRALDHCSSVAALSTLEVRRHAGLAIDQRKQRAVVMRWTRLSALRSDPSRIRPASSIVQNGPQ
jgi:hypothetical protein